MAELKKWLAQHNVPLPMGTMPKAAYVELYEKHLASSAKQATKATVLSPRDGNTPAAGKEADSPKTNKRKAAQVAEVPVAVTVRASLPRADASSQPGALSPAWPRGATRAHTLGKRALCSYVSPRPTVECLFACPVCPQQIAPPVSAASRRGSAVGRRTSTTASRIPKPKSPEPVAAAPSRGRATKSLKTPTKPTASAPAADVAADDESVAETELVAPAEKGRASAAAARRKSSRIPATRTSTAGASAASVAGVRWLEDSPNSRKAKIDAWIEKRHASAATEEQAAAQPEPEQAPAQPEPVRAPKGEPGFCVAMLCGRVCALLERRPRSLPAAPVCRPRARRAGGGRMRLLLALTVGCLCCAAAAVIARPELASGALSPVMMRQLVEARAQLGDRLSAASGIAAGKGSEWLAAASAHAAVARAAAVRTAERVAASQPELASLAATLPASLYAAVAASCANAFAGFGAAHAGAGSAEGADTKQADTQADAQPGQPAGWLQYAIGDVGYEVLNAAMGNVPA